MAIGVLASAAARAQLPPTPPTSSPAATAPLAATPVAVPDNRPHRAQVTFRDGLLEVRAENSSLNAILYEIGRATGMKITGGVNDQRVFGAYGPAAPSDVLATLLDGAGANMLLRESAAEAPLELVLTPRTGGPTPPSPAPPVYASDEARPSRTPLDPSEAPPSFGRNRSGNLLPTSPVQPEAPAAAGNPPANNPLGSPDNTTNTVSTMPTTDSVRTDALPAPSTTTETQQGIVDSPNPPPGAATSASPNGVATPEQIYQQLLKLQQQQSGATPTGMSPTSAATPPQ